jgi:hypothetical protein
MSAAWVWTIVGVAATVILVLIVIFFIRSRREDLTLRIRKSPREFAIDLSESMAVAGGILELFLPPDDAASRAVSESIKKGLLMFNPPAEMIQGHKERVEVRIARSADLREELISGLRGSGEPQFEEIDTSFYMEVRLTGRTFEITSYSPPEQLIIPTPARWEFDLMPCHAGLQAITLSVNMRIEAKGIFGGRRGLSVLEKQINIRVNYAFATHRFVFE